MCDFLRLSGRALEELRSALYNELRTSEGAKRQQQRCCGPVVAMTFNFMVAVGIILANKLVSFLIYHVFGLGVLCMWRIFHIFMDSNPWNSCLWTKKVNCLSFHLSAGPGENRIQFPNLSYIDPLLHCMDSHGNFQGVGIVACLTSLKNHSFLFPFLLGSCHGSFHWPGQYQFKIKQVPVQCMLSIFLTASCFLSFVFSHDHIPSPLCSVGFYQMAKISVTPTIVLAEFILLKKTVSFKKVRT